MHVHCPGLLVKEILSIDRRLMFTHQTVSFSHESVCNFLEILSRRFHGGIESVAMMNI